MTRQMPPAGWYQEPNHGVGLRYWDGAVWTDHVSVSGQQYTSPYKAKRTDRFNLVKLPVDVSNITGGQISADKIRAERADWLDDEKVDEEAFYRPGATKIYWDNLLRIRTWLFSFMTGFAALWLLWIMGVPGFFYTPVFLIMFLVTFGYWMTKQMACRSCRTLLRVTRVSGQQSVCHKCGAPTD